MSNTTPRYVTLKLFFMMVLQLFVWGAWLPLIWGYMGGLGFTGTQIAWVGSTFAIASMLAIFAGNQFVDRTFAAERFMAGSHLIGGAAMLALYFVRDFWPFFALMLVHSVCYVPTISVANSLAFTHLKDARKEFGLVRMGGTVGWILASWPLYFMLQGAQGAELQQGLGKIFLVAGVASLLLAAFSLLLPATPPRAGQAGASPAWLASWRYLVAKPFLVVLFVVTLIDSTIHNGYYLTAGTFLGQLGIPAKLVMPIMSLGQIAEIITMAALGFTLKRLGWKWTMIIGVLGHAGRFLVFAFCSDSVPVIVAVQLLHGICYAFFFATLYIFIDVAFPHDVRTSAQGLFNLLILGVGDLVAKWVFIPLQGALTHDGRVQFDKFFLVPSALAGLAALLLLVAFHPPKTLGAESADAP